MHQKVDEAQREAELVREELNDQVEERVKRMVIQRWMAAKRKGIERAFYLMKCHV